MVRAPHIPNRYYAERLVVARTLWRISGRSELAIRSRHMAGCMVRPPLELPLRLRRMDTASTGVRKAPRRLIPRGEPDSAIVRNSRRERADG